MAAKKWHVFTAAVLVAAAAVLAPPASAQESPGELDDVRPMIFVHGGLGSGQQFEAQALRFASNGYPDDHIELFEHDSLAWPGSQDEVWSRLDQLIADLQDATGSDQVNLLGHSQGTGVVQGYLNSDPARAADVAQYVNLDGGSGGTVPADVETLAVWGEGDSGREIPGATNVQFADQAHTQVVNSPETFAEIFEFFTGEEPLHLDVVREPADEIEVSGRVQLFPANTGATDATLEIHEVDGTTGLRLDDTPEATFPLSGEGRWGPFDADGEAYYEFAIVRDTGIHHVYLQRFVRSNRWAHILTSEPGGLADSFWELSEDSSNLVIFRNKEWWGDQGENGDVLEINGQGILNEATSPRTNRTIGIFVHDAGVDRTTDLSQPVDPNGILFLTGVDLYLPAADPPDGTLSVAATPRLGQGTETVCLPNWASAVGRSSVQFNSYHRTVNPDGSPAEGHADPECGPAAEPPDGPGDPGAPGGEDPVAPPATPVPGSPGFTG